MMTSTPGKEGDLKEKTKGTEKAKTRGNRGVFTRFEPETHKWIDEQKGKRSKADVVRAAVEEKRRQQSGKG